MAKKQNLGIPSTGFEYQNLLVDQDELTEFLKTHHFLKQFLLHELPKQEPEFLHWKPALQFINYGDTQLVYVLFNGKKQYAVLVGQPAVEYGTVKKEFDNLQKLALENSDVIVEPKYYFTNGERELYLAPYLYQARCIAEEENRWGIYIPEPYYHFEPFSFEEQFYVNSCMIANLVRLYNEKEQLGIASIHLDGGDFILEKEWSRKRKSLKNTLQRMKLIAARELISTSFQDYLSLLRKEFAITCEDAPFLSHKGCIPMEEEEIETGIKLGLTLRKQKL